MKANLFSIVLLMLCFNCLFSNVRAQQIRSYARGETTAQTELSSVTQFPTTNMSMTVTWNLDGTLRLMDGSNWKPDGSLWDGTLRYKYTGNSGIPAMPNTTYTTLLMAPDFSVMQLNYVFGMPGMYTNMSTRYTYIGDGAQPAFEYSNSNSSGYFGGGFGGFGF